MSADGRPRLSVVVPVSRGRAFVEPLIRSFEAQTAGPGAFELVLVVDDERRFDSAKIAVKTVRGFCGHPSAKRNAGVAAASATEWLGFVDDDVRVERDWVEKAVLALGLGADVVTGPSDLPYSEALEQRVANAVICSPFFSLKRAVKNRTRELVPFYGVSLCNVAMRRAVWDQVGGFNELAYYWVDDAEFFFLAGQLGFRLLNDPAVRVAHWMRPAVWPLVRHYGRQRWYAGLSTWLFPELYLRQTAAALATAGLLVASAAIAAAAARPQWRWPLLRLTVQTGLAVLTTLGAAGAAEIAPSGGWRARALTAASLALGFAANVLGYWAGLVCGPFFRLANRPVVRYKRYRGRRRDRAFEGREIVQPWPALIKQLVPWRVWRGGFPQWLIYFVTARCNARCPMCFYLDEIERADRGRELSIEEIRRVAASVPPITYLSLSGGEPYLRDDLVAVVQAFIDAADPAYVSIPTNGSLPGRVERALEELSRRNPQTSFDAHLSIDGPAEAHDAIRGEAATYERVLETYARLRPLARRRDNLSVKFVVTCSALNVDSLPPLLERLSALECDRINLVPIHGNVRDKALAVPHERYLPLVRELHERMRAKGYRGARHRLFNAIRRAFDERLGAVLAQEDLGRVCGAGRKIVVLDPYGDVLPCEPLATSVGNVREHGYDLPAVLAGEAMRDFERRHLGPKKCHCNWGCAVGNAMVQDPAFYPAVARELLRDL